VENSPERHGALGCSYIVDKPLLGPLKEPLVWHIDRFDSGKKAQESAGANSIAFQAHGSWWLMAIESSAKDHHGGQHVAAVALPRLPAAEKYSMLVISTYIAGGQTSRVHHHSGVEAFYTVEGEQCLETPTGIHRIPKGGSLAVPAGVTMRMAGPGSKPRRGFGVVVYDASQEPTMRTPELESQLVLCK
jgi:quercetin dioxygenase-like cupin family protein